MVKSPYDSGFLVSGIRTRDSEVLVSVEKEESRRGLVEGTESKGVPEDDRVTA